MLLISSILILNIFGGCAIQKKWTAIGGDKSAGIIRLSYEYGHSFGALEVPKITIEQGVIIAGKRCKLWGYSGAEPFGGTIKQCLRGGININPYYISNSCNLWVVTAEYQCIN
jgi:hypothetical protein